MDLLLLSLGSSFEVGKVLCVDEQKNTSVELVEKKIDKQKTGLNWDRIFYSSGNLSYEEYSRTVSERKCKFMEYSYDSLCKKK